MRKLKACFVAFASLQIAACCFPSPWKEQLFESDASFYAPIPPERTIELERYFVGNAFVSAHIHSTNPNSHESRSPYYLGVLFLVSDENAEAFTVHSVKMSVDGASRDIIEMTDGSIRRDLRKPLKIPFTFMRNPIGTGGDSFAVSAPFSINFDDAPKITVTLDVEVTSDSGSSRKVVTYEFAARETSGLFECLEV